MYKVLFTKTLLIFSIFLSCNNNLAENETNHWIGWYGEVDGQEAWLKVYYEGDDLFAKITQSGEEKTLSAQLIDDASTIDFSFLPLHLERGIPFIKSALKTENFYVFKVEKSSTIDFTSEYYFFVPIPKVGGALKKMKAPAN